MNIQQYRERQKKLSQQQSSQYRSFCISCLQPEAGCYCTYLKPFDPQINFVILIHPIEVRRRIATGRMSHLCLQNSYLISGQDYSDNEQVNRLIADSNNVPAILYPGPDSINLSSLSLEARQDIFPRDKKLTLFVIDGTWATAKKMMRESSNLKKLPKICFSPEKPSTFRVRKQPNEQCYSTIEAIHQTIDLLGDSRGYDVRTRQHDNLLQVFEVMVERQIAHFQRSEALKGAFNSRRLAQAAK